MSTKHKCKRSGTKWHKRKIKYGLAAFGNEEIKPSQKSKRKKQKKKKKRYQ